VTEEERLRQLEARLWKAADQLRANSSLAASQYSTPVLGLIFLRYADVRFTQVERELEGTGSGRRQIGKADYRARGVMYVPETARFGYLRELPAGSDIGQAINRSMEAIEVENTEISIFGQERVEETIRLAKMNLAVHGLGGEIVPSNTYYEDPHHSVGRFDFVIANPPFNVNAIDKDRIKDDKRYPYGVPSVDNGNYLWIQIFSSALNDSGRAGFVMANSASDARHSELAIRRRLIEDRQVDVMVAIGSNFFYPVTLPVTLWFLDKGKRGTDRADQVLFIDARHIHRQIDRAHRDFTADQHEFLANIVRLFRGTAPEFLHGSEAMLKENFPDLTYADVPGLCRIATVDEIETHGWSLNPGRYIDVTNQDDDSDFTERFGELSEDFPRADDRSRRVGDACCRVGGLVARRRSR